MNDPYQFDGYTLREATLDDLPLAARWTDADWAHRETVFPEFWIQQVERPHRECYLLLDAAGPVFFFVMIRCHFWQLPQEEVRCGVDLHIQFAPRTEVSRSRTLQGMSKGLAWLKNVLAQKGFDAIFFTSENPSLIRFCVQRLEFVEVGPGRLKAYLEKGAVS